MKPGPSRWRISFQAKVLLPVVAFLVLLPAATLLLVNYHITKQLKTDARQALLTADAVFRKSREIRARNLLSRYRGLVKEPRFKAVVKTDAPTARAYFNDLLHDEIGGDAEVVLFTTHDGKLLAGAKSDPAITLEEYAAAGAQSIQEALRGAESSDTSALRNSLFNVISIPLEDRGFVEGVLTVGIPMGNTAAQEFKSLTYTEIALIAKDRVAASTLRDSRLQGQVVSLFKQYARHDPAATEAQPPFEVIAPYGEHFLALANIVEQSGPHEPLGYVLLYSYEQPLRDWMATQRALLTGSLLGVLLSTLVVWGLVRKITAPLRLLRTSADAVGRGDFSRKVQVDTADECGELARAFNQMTDNLQASRTELEKTVTTLRDTQDHLVQTEKLSSMGQFVAGVTHELNNPLTSVIGFAQLLDLTEVNTKQRDYIGYIIKSSQRCHKIVQNLLGFARQHAPSRKRASLNEVIASTVELLAYEMRTSNINVVTQLQPDLPKLLLDEHQIQQILVNLLVNARQAIEGRRAGGTIQLRTELAGDWVRLTIQDDGPGIAPENLPKIFDPFFTTKEMGKGTGLGLSLVYGIIQKHDGRIEVQSQPGQGASFIIELPLPDKSHETAFITKDAVASAKNTGAGLRVLVVDDEEWILELVKAVLETEGYAVEIALDGDTAVRHLEQWRFDLVLCDWKLPGLNGEQIYERVRTVQPDLARRVIFMSGDVMNESFRMFQQLHSLTCLPKPFNLPDLRAVIAQLLKATPPS